MLSINGLHNFYYLPELHDVSKAADLLGFEAKTSLDAMLDELIPWIKTQIELGGI